MGAGHWGKDLLEVLLVPLVIALLVRGQRKLNGNAETLRKLFGFIRHYRGLILRYAARVRGWPWQRRVREWAYFPFGHLSNDEDRTPILVGTSALESLIATRTSWVSNFIWYPSLVIAGLFAATFTVQYGQYRFDSNPITLVLSIGLIVAAVVLLREVAESWRGELLRRLSHRRLAQLAAAPPNQEAAEQLAVLIDLVTQLHEGAFAPYSEQPLMRAVLLPAVTFAATAGLPYLHVG